MTLHLAKRAARRVDRLALELVRARPDLNLIRARGYVVAGALRALAPKKPKKR